MEKAADFIVWESSFTPLEKLYRESGMSDWRNRLRDKVKGSLKRPEDIKACKGLLTLKEVKAYLRTTFIKNHSLIHDLLEPINELKTPRSIKDSAENIQTVLKLVSLVKRRDLMEKVTEVHVDQIIKITLLRTDYRDYVREWSERLSRKTKRAHSTRADALDEDDESDSLESDDEIDLEASVREEMAEDTLANRKRFLFKFLERKLNQLKIQLSLETRSVKEEDKEKRGEKKKKSVWKHSCC